MGWSQENARWWMRSSGSRPTITVTEMSAEAQERRARRVKDGAQVVPFGFGRALAPPAEESACEVEPLRWEGDDG